MSRGNVIQSTHDLDFGIAPYHSLLRSILTPELCKELKVKDDDKYPDIEWLLFRVGTCHGQWRLTPEAYEILSIINDKPGNGHFDDVLEWFEYSCKCTRLPLRLLAFTNDRFKKHLIEKRGFVPFGDDVEKHFSKLLETL